jgi:type I restriction enzyme S subunit
MTFSFPTVRFGEVCKLVNGKAFKPEDWSERGHPIIRIQNLNDPSKPFNFWAGSLDRQVRVKPYDVLLAWSGTPGTSFGAHIWRGGPGILNQHIFRVELDHRRITKEWCVLAVNFRLNRLIEQAHGGVGLKHVTRGMVDNLEIPLPAFDEQRRIAAILERVTDLRQKRQQALMRLITLGPAIFAEMFGDWRHAPNKVALSIGWIETRISDERITGMG